MEQKRKTPSTAFKKGQSGNPGGRPKVAGHVKELARQYTAEAVEALVATLREEKGSARVAAAQALLDRGYGKPTQHVEASVSVLDRLSADDLAIVEEALTSICTGYVDGDSQTVN